MLLAGLTAFAQHRPSVASAYNQQFISLCDSAALSLDVGTSTTQHGVDFRSTTTLLGDSLIQQWASRHNEVRLCHFDPEHNTDWQLRGYLPQAVLCWKSIKVQHDSVVVSISKMRATEASNGSEIILMRRAGNWYCIWAEITWIS
ncbi:MAG: hypothetical protein EBZ77_04480 [Chitinophagia bacterium]|nr:hypothetical protein [Chitinophagia bacterium]